MGLAGVVALRLWPGLAQRAGWLSALRWLAVPYVGLLVGGLSPRRMGLSQIDWLAGAGWGVGMILALLGLLWLIQSGDLNLHKSRATAGTIPQPGPASFVVLISGLQEFHWAFLRGGLWSLLRTMDGTASGLPASLFGPTRLLGHLDRRGLGRDRTVGGGRAPHRPDGRVDPTLHPAGYLGTLPLHPQLLALLAAPHRDAVGAGSVDYSTKPAATIAASSTPDRISNQRRSFNT